MARPAQPQPLTLGEALIPVAALIGLVAASFLLFGDQGAKGPNQLALVMATLIALLVAWRRGHSIDALRDAAVASVGSGIYAMFILFAVGALIGTWALSGTLLAMVYYGMQLLSPTYFYLSTAAICGAVAVGIGSSWTTAGTIGIGLVATAQAIGLDPAITAAAVIAGAYLGETSPLSDTAVLASGVSGVDLYEHLKASAWVSVPAFAVALCAFWLLGQPGEFDISEKLAAIEGSVRMTPWLFLPLAIVIVLALFKTPPFTTIFIGALAGGVMAVLVAPDRVLRFADAQGELPQAAALLKGVWLALAGGYSSSTGVPMIDALLSRGGMESMLPTIWLVIAALAFGGVVEKAGVLDRLIAPILAAARSAGAMVASLVASVIATNIVTADQYMAIVLPARMFKKAFDERGIPATVLSRSAMVSGAPTGALIPWNSCGAFMAATLGVATLDYLPYAVFNFASPVIAVVLGYLALGAARKAPKERPT